MTRHLIDATAYLEDTAFADDEFTQFLNEVLALSAPPTATITWSALHKTGALG